MRKALVTHRQPGLPTQAFAFNLIDAPALDSTRWITGRLFSWGGVDPSVANGLLTLNASWVQSQNALTGATRAVEFRARLRPTSADTGWAALGLGRQNDPGGGEPTLAHRLWETDNVNQLFATARDGSGTNLFPLVSGVDLTQFHTFRIEWGPASTLYFVDGALRQTITASSSAQAWAWLYTFNVGSPIQIDWVRVTPYLSTTGELVSCPIDAETTTNWGNLTWAAEAPAGASLSFQTRSSSDGATWSAWSFPMTTSGSPIESPANRYLQYQATLTTSNSLLSPQVDWVTITPASQQLAPAIFNRAANVTSPNTAQVTWQTDQLAFGRVQYGTTPSLGTWLTGTEYITSHVFSLTSLQPDTTYYLDSRVRAGTFELSQLRECELPNVLITVFRRQD